MDKFEQYKIARYFSKANVNFFQNFITGTMAEEQSKVKGKGAMAKQGALKAFPLVAMG